jgi:hypothetical protein
VLEFFQAIKNPKSGSQPVAWLASSAFSRISSPEPKLVFRIKYSRPDDFPNKKGGEHNPLTSVPLIKHVNGAFHPAVNPVPQNQRFFASPSIKLPFNSILQVTGVWEFAPLVTIGARAVALAEAVGISERVQATAQSFTTIAALQPCREIAQTPCFVMFIGQRFCLKRREVGKRFRLQRCGIQISLIKYECKSVAIKLRFKQYCRWSTHLLTAGDAPLLFVGLGWRSHQTIQFKARSSRRTWLWTSATFSCPSEDACHMRNASRAHCNARGSKPLVS